MNNAAFDNKSSKFVILVHSDKIDLIDRKSLECLSFILPAHGSMHGCADKEILDWISNRILGTGSSMEPSEISKECVAIRKASKNDYLRVTWEITERCNFRCTHCYLDEKRHPGLSLDERLRVLDKLERMGCISLQLTGGEPLADPLFEATYRAAWERGMLISIMTNGQRLSHWFGLLCDLPPHRVRVSLYGLSASSFQAMTGASPDALDAVLEGLEQAAALGIRLRVAIIVGRANEHEAGLMEELMARTGIEHHSYSRFSPTLGGNRRPVSLSSTLQRPPTIFGTKKECSGGKNTLHVHVNGKAGPCKLLPYVSVDLLAGDLQDLSKMAWHPGARPATRLCESCPTASVCKTCAPVFTLYKRAHQIPQRICWRQEESKA